MDANKLVVSKRSAYYDLVKFVAYCFVVLIHCPLPGITGEGVTAIARFAVPAFFAISGHFYANKSGSWGDTR